MKFNCILSLSLFHKSSASQKAIYSPFETLIPLFLDNPAPMILLLIINFF